jgi:hypothetical protein
MSLARLEGAALDGPVLNNDVVYAETSIRYERIEDPDAHAAAEGWSLLTRDARLYRTCFPKLTLVAP